MAEVEGERADFAGEAHGLEEGVGHDGLAGPAGMDAVLPGDHVVGAPLLLRLKALHEHGKEDVGKADVLGLGEVDVDIAEIEEVEVEVGDRAGGGFDPVGHFAYGAG